MTPPATHAKVRAVARGSSTTERLHLQLQPELANRVRRYHLASNLPGTPQDSARELILVGLEQEAAADVLVQHARLRAYRAVRKDFDDMAAAFIKGLDSAWAKIATVRMQDLGVGDGGADEAGQDQ